ncbi:7-cyano-7-deazaguanine tRNA-ribosyltransferase [Plakobranchus ocellatus]|uniref:7-cyano-7-deazaguanine tRNA-ribosyltransferase n=1 Tax=Plakobranchus ocellatus TaxID=259542 RepID=A0AAV4E2U6_9GAST|nr:7-cyano-7-deazaguanine tRNA-ribosyltransferase [Plakobranchus ocellatus]
MYNLYLDEREAVKESIVRSSIYKQVFYSEYNLGFFKRSKDKCDFCKEFGNRQDKESMREEYDQHHRMKDRVRDLKNIDKNRAKTDCAFPAATFDLDVLVTPKGSAKGF